MCYCPKNGVFSANSAFSGTGQAFGYFYVQTFHWISYRRCSYTFHFYSKNSLPFSRFSWFWLDGDEKCFCGLSLHICQLPFHLFRFLPALHGCTRRFYVRSFINPTYFLFFFCQFSLLSHFSNLRDHWNNVEKSVLVAFWHAWRSKGWKRLHNLHLREDVWGVPSL